jgi:ribosomal protein S18 acetylase RimI-like enzyme
LVVAEREGVQLRYAKREDLPKVAEIAIICYSPIQESYVSMLGEECYQAVRSNPELTWEERKTGQILRLFDERPEQVWVLEFGEQLIGFVTFHLFPAYGHLDNNGVHPDFAGQGLGKFMYRQVLNHFRELGLRFAHVDTGLDPAHEAARRAYESVGFDRQAPEVHYWQDLIKQPPEPG